MATTGGVKIFGIQYLRGFAALAVLIFHDCEHNHFDFRVGNAGVDVFFIISGFVMWFTTCGRAVTFAQFMRKRLVRLVPLYWVATLAIVAVIAVKPQFFPVTGLPEIIKSLLFIPYMSSYGHAWPVIMQGWTLNIEMLFYVVFACALAAGPTLRLYISTAVLCGAAIAGIVFEPKNVIIATWTSSYFFEFTAGLWLGFAYTQAYVRQTKLGWLLMIVAVGAYLGIEMLKLSVDNVRVVTLGLPSLLLVLGTLMVTQNAPKIASLAFLGDASYSIYLWHGLAQLVIAALGVHVGLQVGALAAVIVAVLSLGISLLAYICIERPLTEFFKRKRYAPAVTV
jgi:exopolysaccharide production protein ExoZ